MGAQVFFTGTVDHLRYNHLVFKMGMLLLVVLALFTSAEGLDDLKRARTKVPRNEYRNTHSYHMGKSLNGHLKRSHQNVKPCYELEHDIIYAASNDNRGMRFAGLDEYLSHWDDINRVAAANSLLGEMQRDGHCLEAVMWWVHHLSHNKKQELKDVAIPSLPLVQWQILA